MYVMGMVLVVFSLVSGGYMTSRTITRREWTGLTVVVQRLQNVSEGLNMTCPWGGEYDY